MKYFLIGIILSVFIILYIYYISLYSTTYTENEGYNFAMEYYQNYNKWPPSELINEITKDWPDGRKFYFRNGVIKAILNKN